MTRFPSRLPRPNFAQPGPNNCSAFWVCQIPAFAFFDSFALNGISSRLAMTLRSRLVSGRWWKLMLWWKGMESNAATELVVVG